MDPFMNVKLASPRCYMLDVRQLFVAAYTVLYDAERVSGVAVATPRSMHSSMQVQRCVPVLVMNGDDTVRAACDVGKPTWKI